MKEQQPFKPEQEAADTSFEIEQLVNYETSDSQLLFERLQHPVVREQLLDLFMDFYEQRAASATPEHVPVRDTDTGALVRDANGKVLFEEQPFVMPTRDQVAHKLDERIEEITNHTNITYDGQEPSPNSVDLNWKLPDGSKPTAKQYAIIEAHEKGHRVRAYPSFGKINPIRERFLLGFDPEAVEYTRALYEQEEALNESGRSFEEAQKHFYRYLFSPGELAERMAQLKNYFGITGDEQFTAEHLAYAREHYVEDTGFDNRMAQFFQAITPERESAFLETINGVGI